MGAVTAILPVPAANAPGAWVDTSLLGPEKTVLVGGTLVGFMTVEVSNEASPTDGAPIFTFENTGSTVLEVVARWMRVTVTGYKQGAASAVVAADNEPTRYLSLVVPPAGTSGSSMTLTGMGDLKTVTALGTFAGTILVEASADGGATWSQLMSFSNPGLQTLAFTANLLRVSRTGVPQIAPGLPTVSVGSNLPPGGTSGLINVLDFGARGGADSTTAFANAIIASEHEGIGIYAPNVGAPYLVAPDTIRLTRYGAALKGDPGSGGGFGTQITIVGAGFAGIAVDGGAARQTVTAVSVSADTLTIPGHGFNTGSGPLQFLSTVSLPGGMNGDVHYFAILIDPNTIQVAVTEDDAIAGNHIDITSPPVGVLTVDLLVSECEIENIVLSGNAAVQSGFFVRAVHHSRFAALDVRNVVFAAFEQRFGVANLWEQLVCSVNDHSNDWTVVPQKGIKVTNRLDDGSGADHSEDATFVNAIIEGLAGNVGIYLDACDTTQFIGGTSESNGIGYQATRAGGDHQINGPFFFDVNTTADIDCDSFWNVFDGILTTGLVHYEANSYGNLMRGGEYAGTVRNSSVHAQRFEGAALYNPVTIDGGAAPFAGYYWKQPTAVYVERLPGLSVFADNAAALGGGLVVGDVYRTATGQVMVVF